MLRQMIVTGLFALSLLSCNDEGVFFLPPDSGVTGNTTTTTSFSNIELKTHIPNEISDGAGGTLKLTYQGFEMGNSDASIVYSVKFSDNTYSAYKPGNPDPVELISNAGGVSLNVSGNGSKVFNGLNVIDYATGATQAIGTAIGSSLGMSIVDSGDLVLFTSSNDLTGGNPDNVYQIFTLATDGSEIYNQITSFTVSYGMDYLRVSGDGSKIFFMSASDVLAEGSNSDGSDEIYSIDSNGTNLIKHTTLNSGLVYDIKVSSDGGVVAVVLKNYNGNTAFGLYTIDTTTDTLTYIADLVSPSKDYDLSADGKKIVYAYTDESGSYNKSILYRINTDGTSRSSVLVIETALGNISRLHVNSDGTKMTFESRMDFGKGVTADEYPAQIYTLTKS